jgi:hypothetical protein
MDCCQAASVLAVRANLPARAKLGNSTLSEGYDVLRLAVSSVYPESVRHSDFDFAFAAIATFTALCGESTGGIWSTTTVLFSSPSRCLHA